MTIEQTIQQIGLQEREEKKQELLEQLKEQLSTLRQQRKEKYLIPLLYDENWYIRQEGAFLIDQLGLTLKDEDYYRYLLALQDFENLFLAIDNPLARKVIFETLKDANHRLRFKIFKYLKFEDCQTKQEKALFWYGRADYERLVHMAEESEAIKDFIKELLQMGMQPNHNPDYHRRRCAEALQRIEYSEKVELFLNELLGNNKQQTGRKPNNKDLRPVPLNDQEPDLLFRLQNVMAYLTENGIWVDGKLIFPQIQIGSTTNRITYRNPALQTWPKETREQHITPPPNKILVAFDYVSIEPRLLLNFLLKDFIISLADVPKDDVYLAFYPQDRQKGKQMLNTIINGGYVDERMITSSFGHNLIEGIQQLRLEQMSFARQNGYVETIAGHKIPLAADVANFAGKVLNRLVQGSASDVFNLALCQLFEQIQANTWPIQIYFVIYDEMWLALPRKDAEQYLKPIATLLNTIYRDFNLLIPLPCRMNFITKSGEV